MLTHHVRYDEPGLRMARAICGRRVWRADSAVEPTCPDCIAALAALDAADPTPARQLCDLCGACGMYRAGVCPKCKGAGDVAPRAKP